jgi:hypothetical protein
MIRLSVVGEEYKRYRFAAVSVEIVPVAVGSRLNVFVFANHAT